MQYRINISKEIVLLINFIIIKQDDYAYYKSFKYNKHKNNLYNTNKLLSNIGIYNNRRQLVSIIYNFKKEKIMKF